MKILDALADNLDRNTAYEDGKVARAGEIPRALIDSLILEFNSLMGELSSLIGREKFPASFLGWDQYRSRPYFVALVNNGFCRHWCEQLNPTET
jgi:hypothetical protein